VIDHRVLVGLLLAGRPVRARESRRGRMQCKNNLKKIGLGAATIRVNLRTRFPAGVYLANDGPWSWRRQDPVPEVVPGGRDGDEIWPPPPLGTR